jgi:hypothetical protein
MLTIEKVARVAHEANRAFCVATGDDSQPSWDEAPEWQKGSARAGVKFCVVNPNAPPSANHESWLEQKRRDGWVYGATKSAEDKTHPCIVPYDELPVEQRAKDYLFRAVVHALAESCGVGPDGDH